MLRLPADPRKCDDRPASPPPCVVITTYARPDGLALLLGDIERAQPPGGLDVRVYDDATPNADEALERRVCERGWTYRRAAANHGKQAWWRWWNRILADLRAGCAERIYVLQDDMRLCERFFQRSAALWAAIDDPQKASLYLHLSAERAELGGRCWTPVRARRVGPAVRSGWVDCAAFLCDRRLFQALGWRLHPIAERRWHGSDIVSSGVGQQISVRAHQAGLSLYRVAESLTVHDGGPSLMSAEARRRWSMATIGFVDGEAAAAARIRRRPHVFASLATIPARERGLERVVEALLPQVDALGVHLNGHARVPRWLDREKVIVVRSQDGGDRGDAGKFSWAGTTSGYQLVCDDDMDYPGDYVERLVEGIERHGRRAVVGFHGAVLGDPVVDYFRSRRLLHFTSGLTADTPVHVLGTGAAGYHVSAIRVTVEDFPEPNMADISLALLGQHRRVPFVCLRREPGWLAELPGFREDSIYARARHGGGPENQAIRAHDRWTLHPSPRAEVRAVARPGHRQRPRPLPRLRPRVAPLVRIRVAGPTRGGTLVLPERDDITEAVQRSGTYYERDLLDAIHSRAPTGAFVDVGAHYGNHTAFFALECGAERVIAIEPSPAAHAGLVETVRENELEAVVATHRLAVHPEWRRVAVTALPWRPRPGSPAHSNSGRVGIAPAARDGDAFAAPLDEILDDVAGVGVVKVDAEGMSAEILSSARRMLRRDRPLVAAEAASDAERHALRALLGPLGYREARRYCWTATWLWEPQPLLHGST